MCRDLLCLLLDYLDFAFCAPIGQNIEYMSGLKEITDKIVAFRDARDWKQFHNPKDMALSLTLEAAEVMEHFQWKNEEDIKKYLATENGFEGVSDELADVLYWVLLISHDLGIDIKQAFEKKIVKTGKKYPVDVVKGKYSKWTEY